MKLVHPEWETPVIFDDEHIPVMAIENAEYFYEMTNELYQQTISGEGRFVLYEDEKELEIKKNAVFINSPWDIDFENRQILKKLYECFQNAGLSEAYYKKTNQIIATVLQYVEELQQEISVPVCYDWDPDIKLLFKAVNLQVDEEGLSLVERMVEYMKICTELIGSALFIFNQFRAYLDDAQLEEFYRTILDEKIPVMLMEGREYDKIKGESWFIIDKDLCQIF